jgi:hypothetical protein
MAGASVWSKSEKGNPVKTKIRWVIVAAALLTAWNTPLGAQDDEFAAFREMEKQAFAAFAEMDEGARLTWESRDRELARAWKEERKALLASYGEVEKEAKDNPLKTVETDADDSQVAQSQIDFEAGKVKVEAVVVAASAAEARQKAEELARQKLQQATAQVPAADDQTLEQQATNAGTSEQQTEALQKTYDETEKTNTQLPDGQVEARVSLEQSLTGENGLTLMALAAAEEKAEEKPEKATPPAAADIVLKKGPFTGLLLDASGVKKAKPSLVPTVRARDGSLVYGPAKVKKEKAIHGMADWLRAATAVGNSKKLGDNPLKIKIDTVKRGGRMIVSDADAALIRAADAGFLADCQVAVLLGK